MIAPHARPTASLLAAVALVLAGAVGVLAPRAPLGEPGWPLRSFGGAKVVPRMSLGHRCKCVEPDPTTVFAVRDDLGATEGPPDALVTIVWAYEYASPYCDKVRSTIARLRQRYPRELRVVKQQSIVHPQVAIAPALAACAAGLQGKFDQMDARLWSDVFRPRRYRPEQIEMVAASIGLDLERYRRDIATFCPVLIALEDVNLSRFGGPLSPTFFINGRYLPGAQPLEAFEKIIDEELAKAKERIEAGASRRSYYRDWVIDRGLPRFDRRAIGPRVPDSSSDQIDRQETERDRRSPDLIEGLRAF